MTDRKAEISYLQKKLQLTNELLVEQYAKFCASQKKEDLDKYAQIDYELLLLRNQMASFKKDKKKRMETLHKKFIDPIAQKRSILLNLYKLIKSAFRLPKVVKNTISPIAVGTKGILAMWGIYRVYENKKVAQRKTKLGARIVTVASLGESIAFSSYRSSMRYLLSKSLSRVAIGAGLYRDFYVTYHAQAAYKQQKQVLRQAKLKLKGLLTQRAAPPKAEVAIEKLNISRHKNVLKELNENLFQEKRATMINVGCLMITGLIPYSPILTLMSPYLFPAIFFASLIDSRYGCKFSRGCSDLFNNASLFFYTNKLSRNENIPAYMATESDDDQLVRHPEDLEDSSEPTLSVRL